MIDLHIRNNLNLTHGVQCIEFCLTIKLIGDIKISTASKKEKITKDLGKGSQQNR